MREIDPYPLESASSQHKDWTGSVSADESEQVGSVSLEDAVGLDHEKWMIVAVNVYRHFKKDDVTVYAIDRHAWGLDGPGRFPRWEELVAERGSIPVVEFHLSRDVDLMTLIDGTFKTFSLQIRHHRAVAGPGHPIEVVGREERRPAR